MMVAGAVLALLVGPVAVHAHGAPADLSVWGGFNPLVARCQRSISRAASLCASRTLYARTRCSAAQLRGETCDTAALDAAVQAARGRARDTVARDCDGEQLTTLRYVDLGDAQADVINICRQLDTAASTAAFAPASFGGTIAAMTGDSQACVDATARAGNALLRYAMRTRQRALDTIAFAVLTPAVKTSLIARSQAAIDRAANMARARVAAVCPATTFHDLYGQDMDAVLDRIAGRADCLGQYVYVQNAVTCPAARVRRRHADRPPTRNATTATTTTATAAAATASRPSATCSPPPTTSSRRRSSRTTAAPTTPVTAAPSRAASTCAPAPRTPAWSTSQSETVPGTKRVDPGSKETSLLWINLAARTLPDQVHGAAARHAARPATRSPKTSSRRCGLWIEIRRRGTRRQPRAGGKPPRRLRARAACR